MKTSDKTSTAPWIYLVFTLSGNKASQRVGVWRKLQQHGALAFRNSGYLLPNTQANRERFAWLATSIRGFKGEASVLEVLALDHPTTETLQNLFREERRPDYKQLIADVRKLNVSSASFAAQLTRMKRRLDEIREIDFFESSLRTEAERVITEVERPAAVASELPKGKLSKANYQRRSWITRPRPGIDRVSSAWLIRRFIDPKASFVFAKDVAANPRAVPFDMYQPGGFGHERDNCTFEVLCRRFDIRDRAVRRIAQAIHDADLEDGKFGRTEGLTTSQILKGWAKQGVPDDELMRRGIDLIEGLYQSLV
jgi:hypothetical protein